MRESKNELQVKWSEKELGGEGKTECQDGRGGSEAGLKRVWVGV